MPSSGETIIETVLTTLNAGSPPITFTRANQFQRNDADASLPSGNVYPLQEKVTRQGNADACRTLSIAVEVQVKGAPPIDQAADSIYLWVAQTLLADDTLGGLVWRVKEVGKEWAFETADEDVCGLRITFDIEYATARTDPAQNISA